MHTALVPSHAGDLPFEVARRALAEARAALGLDVAWFGQFVGDRLVVRALDGDGAAFGIAEGDVFPLADTFCAHMVAGALRCWVPDVAAEPVAARLPSATLGPKFGAYVGVPVRHADGQLYGSLCGVGREPLPGLDERDARLLTALAGVVAGQLEHEHRYHQVLESASEPVWVTDLAGRTVFANEALAGLLGVERASLEGRTAFDFLDEEQGRRCREALARRGGGTMERYEIALTTADGRSVPVEVHGAPLTDPEGMVTGTVATIVDLTERKAAERLVESRFRWLAEHVDHQIWVEDAELGLLFVNGRLTDYYGLASPPTRTTAFFAAIHPDEREAIRATVTAGRARGTEYRAEMRLRRHDGTYRTHLMRSIPVRDDAGTIVRWYGLCTDLTDARAQEALAESEAGLREAQRIAQLGSFAQDIPGGPLVLSDELLHMLDLSRADVSDLGEAVRSRVHPDDLGRVQAMAAAAAATGSEFGFDHRVVLPDGTVRTVHARGTYAPGPDGATPARLTGTVQDVTEQRAAEAAARGAAEAERASAAKSEFLSRMSHELRTPLNAILGFGQLLELEPLTEEERESVTHILKGGAHLLQLINEVLEISRIEAGALRLSLEAVDLVTAVGDVVELVSPLSLERGVTIRVDAGGVPASWVRADLQRVKQIVLNLLSNAIKYNRPGGMVTVRVRAAEGGRTRLVVSDTGPGLLPAEIERVFSPFERLGADGATEGTGLGLTLSRSLAEAMDGELIAHSEPGFGCDLTLVLEAAPAPAPARDTTASPLAPEAAGRRGRRVLCVEDNPSNLRLVERVLSRAGVEVIGAPQGRLGLELARRHVPDLVLLDLDLPDVSGEAVLSALAADPVTAGVPVVICSADASKATVDRLRGTGAGGYLTKPLDVAELLKTVARMTDGVDG